MFPLSHKRILDISYKNKTSHLSSCLTAVDIIDEIYQKKKSNDLFVLSCGHAFLALAVILEKYEGKNAEELVKKHGTHPNRDVNDKIWCSSGSLGCGLPIACGLALSDKTREVYCLISDGESFEGSIYETLNFIEKYRVDNLKVYCNINGFSALEKVGSLSVAIKLKTLHPNINIRFTNCGQYPFLNGVGAHYYTLTGADKNKLDNA